MNKVKSLNTEVPESNVNFLVMDLAIALKEFIAIIWQRRQRVGDSHKSVVKAFTAYFIDSPTVYCPC